MGGVDADEAMDSYGTDVADRDRTPSAVLDWILLRGNRLFITATLMIAVFLFLLSMHVLGFLSVVSVETMTRVSQGLIAGTFALVTLVVTVNQLILSREFRTADEFRSRLEGVMDFRRDLEDAAGVAATPAAPAAQFELLVAEIEYRAGRLEETAATVRDDDARERITEFAASVRESSDRVRESLDQARFGSFEALSATMGYDDAWQLHAARHLDDRYEDELSADTHRAIEDVIEAIRLFNTSRQHFKTTYLQRELTRLSQLTILFGIPAVLSGFLLGFLYAGTGGPMISLTGAPFVVSGLITIGFSPLALLTAYILRAATITRRTASIGPMLPQKDPDEGPFAVSHESEVDAD